VIHFDIAGCENEIKRLEELMNAQDFWLDLENSKKTNIKLKQLKDKVLKYNALKLDTEDMEALLELWEESQDGFSPQEVLADVAALRKRMDEMYLETLLSGPYDQNSAIVSLHAGAGGTESMDWVSMLLRMYTRWCEDKKYEFNILDFLPGEEAGVKSVTFEAVGENAYGYLKSEKGVHRLVRISPYDSSSRRHTSFASVDVMPEISDDMEIEIKPEDLKIDTFRSGGAGGQHVNKTESAIRITHLPTGIITQCQNERSQIQNRETAMKILKSKLLELKEREAQDKIKGIKGEMKKIEWGSQIRSYVFHPYSLIKDHRTGAEAGNVQSVMDGDLDIFIDAYLKQKSGSNSSFAEEGT
jgi:peptide chain release factor 2